MNVTKTDDHTKDVLNEIESRKRRVLEMIGIKSEKYAKALCPVGTPESTGIPGYRGGTLRDSITHEVHGDTMYIGTNTEYAQYVELGTYKMRKRPYLAPSILDHLQEYLIIIRNELK